MPRSAQSSDFKAFCKERGCPPLQRLVGYGIAKKFASNTMAPNHPHLPRIAQYLNVEPAELEKFCKGKPLAETQVLRLTSRLAKSRKPGPRGDGKTLMLHPTESSAARGRTKRLTGRPIGRPPGSGQRNSLKRQTLDLREAVRGMLTTTNVAVMKGDRYVSNLPTRALYLVLTDYAERRGIKTAVVLHPDFADLFD